MKRLLIQVSGSTRPPFKIKIRPGTTSRNILSHLNLAGYVLATTSDLTTEFAPEADVYRYVRNGARLIAMTRVEAADRFMENLAFGSGNYEAIGHPQHTEEYAMAQESKKLMVKRIGTPGKEDERSERTEQASHGS
jgi:hypothetical protein